MYFLIVICGLGKILTLAAPCTGSVSTLNLVFFGFSGYPK